MVCAYYGMLCRDTYVRVIVMLGGKRGQVKSKI